MKDENESFVRKRILGMEKKNRVRITTKIEKELYMVMKANCLNISDIINISLEEFLKKKGLLK